MKEVGVLRTSMGAAAPTPARTLALSTLPCLLSLSGNRWWVPAGSVRDESVESGQGILATWASLWVWTDSWVEWSVLSKPS